MGFGKGREDGVWIMFSIASHPRGTRENVDVNVRASSRKQYPLAIICPSICEDGEEAAREGGKKIRGDGASPGWN